MKVENGTLAVNALMESSAGSAGKVWLGMVDSAGINGDGPVTVITFQITGQGANSPLTLENFSAHNAQTLANLAADISHGTITVNDHSFTSSEIVFTGQ